MSTKASKEEKVTAFKTIGLSDSKVEDTLKNESLSNELYDIIKNAKSHLNNNETTFDKTTGNLLYHLATRLKAQLRPRQPLLINSICTRQLCTEAQLNAAFDFLMAHLATNTSSPLDMTQFNESCGVGVHVSAEEIGAAVQAGLAKHRDELLAKRYRFNTGALMAELRAGRMRWADGKLVKSELDAQLLSVLGPRTAEDDLKPTRVPVEAAASNKKQQQPDNEHHTSSKKEEGILSFMELAGDAMSFHKPGENYKTDGYVITDKTMSLLAQHVKETGGQVVTRFPPEPNGILHIGHAKAINFNFGYAKHHNGICYLRFDDTNPEKEEERYFQGIIEMVDWLGYKPYKITHASDHFDKLYELCRELIRRDKAYVCEQKVDELKGHNPPPSPYRDRPIDESLRLFEDMRKGKYAEGDMSVRMKHTMEDGKLDPVAYRIKYAHHARTGNKWCIYPTYDFTHCINDSLENISHSLCTKEFQARRSSYYWLNNALDLYCPVQWEYGRLNLNYTVVSKRKLMKLIQVGHCQDWDDPKLYTLSALRRRGYPPEAINMFCAKVGVTMAQTSTDLSLLESCVRTVLNVMAPRCMAVLDPLKVTLLDEGFPGAHEITVPNFPTAAGEDDKGTHKVWFDKVLYIDASDFAESTVADKGYKRLSLAQQVGLRYAGYQLEVTKVVKDEKRGGKPVELVCKCIKTTEQCKPKGFIQWVSRPIECQVRLYDKLFVHENPEDAKEVPGGWLSDINKNALTVLERVLVDESVRGAKHFAKFQFERVGYFSVDPDSTDELMVFNRTVSLKEDAEKSTK